MNFTDIYKKIKSIDEGQGVMAPPSGPEMPIEECGIEVMPPHAPAQQDNVTMNVSMTGNGAGGIRDLMSILRDLEDKESEADIITSEPSNDIDVMLGDMEEEYGNSAHGASGEHTASIQDVTNVGTTTNGGDHTRNRQAGLPQANAHSMHESVVDRLQNLYTQVKRRNLHEGCLEDPHKHALAHILMADRHGHNQLIKTGVASPDLYENLYDYYWDDMPREIKKHPDHQVRHDHVVNRCKADMLTPECVQAMSGGTVVAPQPTLEQ